MSEPTVPVLGLPAGVVALAVTDADGRLPRDRRGRVKAATVRLTADGELELAVPGTRIDGIAERDFTWIGDKPGRLWSSIHRRFGDAADRIAMRLVGLGVVDLVCAVGDDLRIGAVKHWRLTEPWENDRRRRTAHRTSRAEYWRTRADAAAQHVAGIDARLSATLLRTRPTNMRLPALVHAAEDLAKGISHDGPRAFSQTHFGTTKDRDDVAAILTDAGADPATLVRLGLLRSPYLGLGGPIRIRTDSGQCDLSTLDGPVQFRVTNLGRIDPVIVEGTRDLAIIENLQAAEAISDGFPEVAVVWCAGQPADSALGAMASLAEQIERVFVATDADWGGVRIAKRIVTALAHHPKIMIVDVGTHPHPGRDPFGATSAEGLTVLADGCGLVPRFARACLARGYPVEQEATIRAALSEALTTP